MRKQLLKMILASATIIIFTRVAYSQEVDHNVDLWAKSDKEQIADIDNMSWEIKANLNKYTKTVKVSDSTVYRYVFMKGSELKQITVFGKDQNIDKYVVWYFHNEQLIYSEQLWTDSSIPKMIDNEKFYLDNEHLFVWFKDNKCIDNSSSDFKKMADDLTDYASDMKTANIK